jgi:hypothetical protein
VLQPAKQQFDIIQSMLAKGHGFTLCPHTLPLWGVALGLQNLLSKYHWYIVDSEILGRGIEVFSLAFVLVLTFLVDQYLTRRWKAKHQEVIPLVQKQVMRLVGFSLLIAMTLEILAQLVGTNSVLRSSGMFVVGMIFFNAGLFSKIWYSWAGFIFTLLASLIVAFEAPRFLQIWFTSSVFIVGFIGVQLLSSTKNSIYHLFFSSIILATAIMGSGFGAYYLHNLIVKHPGDLTIYQLSDHKPAGKFILELPKGTIVSGALSVDKFTVQPIANMPNIKIKITKTLQFVFEHTVYRNTFKVGNKKWEDREPFQTLRPLSYVLITTPDGLKFDIFIPYFTSKGCDCVTLLP